MTSRVRRARSYNLATTLQLKRSGIRSDVVASKTAVSTSCTFIRRLALTNTLDYHDGCVNTIEFDGTGQYLLSGSDDRKVALWSAYSQNLLNTIDTGHRRNIFDAQFRPSTDFKEIITCAMDGQVLLHDLARDTHQQIYQAGHMTLKAHFPEAFPHTMVFCCADGDVMLKDFRQDELVPLHSIPSYGEMPCIALHPFHDHLYAHAQFSNQLQLFDLRYNRVDGNGWSGSPVASWAPASAQASDGVSSLHFNPLKSGELLVNFRDHDLVLTDANTWASDNPATEDPLLMVYQGRENSQTFAKQARFLFGGEFVATGCDRGRMHIWHKDSGQRLRQVPADGTILNCVTPHPHLPMVATSGIDSTVKWWSCSDEYYTGDGNSSDSDSDDEDWGGYNLGLRSLLARRVLSPSDAEASLAQADIGRQAGNDLFREKHFAEALSKYDETRRFLRFRAPTDQIRTQQQEQLKKLLVNIAATLYQLKEYQDCGELCTEILEMDPVHIKALYRRAQACGELKMYNQAFEDISKGLSIAPTNSALLNLQKKLKLKRSRDEKARRERFRGLFATSAD